MRDVPGRGVPGLQNAVVFGRQVTFMLQNLRSVFADFDGWYEEKKSQMSTDPFMKFFNNLRTQIEKQAHPVTMTGTTINFLSSQDMQRLMSGPRPENATGFFMGDPENGGSGWTVRESDGSEGKYYVSLPAFINVKVDLHLLNVPAEVANGRTTDQLVAAYLDYMEGLIREAQQRFGSI